MLDLPLQDLFAKSADFLIIACSFDRVLPENPGRPKFRSR
jgi:hypothetical protein